MSADRTTADLTDREIPDTSAGAVVREALGYVTETTQWMDDGEHIRTAVVTTRKADAVAALAVLERQRDDALRQAETMLRVLASEADALLVAERARVVELQRALQPFQTERMDDPTRPIQFRVFRDETYVPTNAEARTLLETIASDRAVVRAVLAGGPRQTEAGET